MWQSVAFFSTTVKTYTWSTREKVILITFCCSELLTQFQTSMTSSCVETFKGKILAEKVTHCYLNLVWGGSQYSDWTKLFQLVFQCNPFLMNLLSCTKEREERGHLLGSSPLHLILKRNLWLDPQAFRCHITQGWVDWEALYLKLVTGHRRLHNL